MRATQRSLSESLTLIESAGLNAYGSLSHRSKYLKPSTRLADIWLALVPEYSSGSTRNLLIDRALWSDECADEIRRISEKRAANRIRNYLDQKEIVRIRCRLQKGSECSVRFGVAKGGHGYGKERGDFCLTSGVVDGRNLFLFYRSLELIGGLGYDLCLIRELGTALDIKWRTLSIFAAHAFIFALKGNSNQKLYPKMRRIFNGADIKT